MSLETDKIIVTIIILLFLFFLYSQTYKHTHTTYNIPHPCYLNLHQHLTPNTHHKLQSQLITNFKTQMHIILQFIVSPILFVY